MRRRFVKEVADDANVAAVERGGGPRNEGIFEVLVRC